MVHVLKISPNYFKDVKSGVKSFEIRKNDRNYQVGDILILQEYSPEFGYTTRQLLRYVTYLFDNSEYVKEGYVILGISGGDER